MFLNYLSAYWQAIWGGSPLAFTVRIFDILVVFFIVYKFLTLVKGTKSMQILSGFVVLLMLYFIGGQVGPEYNRVASSRSFR